MTSKDSTAAQALRAELCSSSAFISTNTPHTLASLPNDVLLPVWMHLEDPVPLSRVNKRFQALSKDTLCRAKWLTQRYPRYLVIFEAIARPKIFTPALLDRLLRLGAPLSRNLAQLAHALGNAASRKVLLDWPGGREIGWGRLSSLALSAIMQQAMKLYDNDVSLEPKESDSYTYEEWVTQQYEEMRFGQSPERSPLVQSMFAAHSFMPLPLVIDSNYRGEVYVRSLPGGDILRAILMDPSLASLAARNGYIYSQFTTEWILTRSASTMQADERRMCVNHLLVNGVLRISKDCVISLFADRFRLEGRQDLQRWEWKELKRIDSTCELLVDLNKESALPFWLEDVITEGLEAGEKALSLRAGDESNF